LSIVLALFLWLAVASDRGHSAHIALQAPLEIRNLPEGMELVGTVPSAFRVWVRGTSGLAQRLRPGEVYIPVDLANAAPGVRLVHLTEGSVRVPYGARPVAIEPASLTLTLERTLRRSVPVKPTLAGSAAAGYRVAGTSVTPAEVAVAGPESRIAPLRSLATEPVSVQGAKMTLVREVGLPLTEPDVRILDPQKVRVTVNVEAGNAR
jgi:YbbR domain-containing protein